MSSTAPGRTGSPPSPTASSSRLERAGNRTDRPDLLIVTSTGGHLMEMVTIDEAWRDFSRVWVTFDRPDARYLLRGERVVIAHSPTNRHAGNLARNAALAYQTIRTYRPRVVLATGAGVAVPFAWAAKAFGIDVLYFECATRTKGPSLSLRLLKPAASEVYGQWPVFSETVPGTQFVGNILFDE